MKFISSHTLKILAVSLVAMGLTACNTIKGRHATADAASPSGEQSARTYALMAQENYQGAKRKANGEIINPLTAPANQVYYFSFDSNVVRNSDYRALTIQANYLADHPNAKVRLEGNTDNRGSREYNIGLGWRRDQAIARMLEQQGVRPNQIDMVSYGKEKPAVLGSNQKAWQLNRRVKLVYEAQ